MNEGKAVTRIPSIPELEAKLVEMSRGPNATKTQWGWCDVPRISQGRARCVRRTKALLRILTEKGASEQRCIDSRDVENPEIAYQEGFQLGTEDAFQSLPSRVDTLPRGSRKRGYEAGYQAGADKYEALYSSGFDRGRDAGKYRMSVHNFVLKTEPERQGFAAGYQVGKELAAW